MDDLYRDEILEHYRHPHNFGTLDAPSVSHEEHNPLCGDRITMMLALSDEGKVTDVAFSGRGSANRRALPDTTSSPTEPRRLRVS